MAEQRTLSLIILGIIAVIAIVGLILMFTQMSATGGITTWGRAIAKTSGKAYSPKVPMWGKAITGVPTFQVGTILGQPCLVVTKTQAENGVIPIADFNNVGAGAVCYPYFTATQQNTDSVCCTESYIQQTVSNYNTI